MRNPALTRQAQAAVAERIRSGDRVIDATVGNGHDTLFLARCVAPRGQVLGFDIQPAALQTTALRLRAAGISEMVELRHHGHEQMAQRVPDAWVGRVAAVMINLGYLPGSDKSVVTRAATTLPALDQALSLLRRGGLLSLLVYHGHPGAKQEAVAVARWVARLDAHCQVTRHKSPGPTLLLISTAA